MSKLPVIVLAIFTIIISVRCLAERLDDSESQLSRKDVSENLETDPEDTERTGLMHPYVPTNNLLRPVYPANNMRLVECHACADCPRILPNTTTKYCPYTTDFTKNHKCVVYAEKYSQMEKPWYIRGCASERGSCADIARAHDNANARIVKLLYCAECDTDKCNTNGVYRSLPNLTAAIIFVIVTPLLGKYALS